MNWTSAPLVDLLRQAECKIQSPPKALSEIEGFIPQYNQLKNSIKRTKKRAVHNCIERHEMNLTSAPLVNLLRQAECKIPITPEGSAMKTFIPQYNQLKNSIKRKVLQEATISTDLSSEHR